MKIIMNRPEDTFVDKALILALWLWITVTALFVVGNGALYLLKGLSVFQGLVKRGPISIIQLTLASVAIVWFGLGTSLVLLKGRGFRARHGITVICTLFVVVLYANILRERTEYGDVGDYIRAAENLAHGVPFHSRYLYPPLLATALEPLVPLGKTVIEGICWTANIISLGLFAVLLTSVLTKYGFGNRLSSLLTLLFLTINVPILRTLGYVQVNLHVTNLILICLLSYPRLPILSAFALALAVHLKVSPIVLALPFLLNRDWRWTAWFVGMMVALAGVTIFPHGWQPFFDFVRNLQSIYSASGIAFRETSVDSFFRSSALIGGIPLGHVFWPIAITKACILTVVLLAMVLVMKNGTFVRTNQAGCSVYNALPVLLIFMLLGSPLVWEHHPVFVALPYLLVLKRLNGPSEWVLYGFAYFLEYHVPTFDFFPWSFGRLLSPLILLGIICATSRRTEDGSLWRAVAKLCGALCCSQSLAHADKGMETDRR
jgi:hypothetical protein